MKNYQKILMGVGAATVITGGVVVAMRYQMVKEQEEKALNSATGRLVATGAKVKNKISGAVESKQCSCRVVLRRMLKAVGLTKLGHKLDDKPLCVCHNLPTKKNG